MKSRDLLYLGSILIIVGIIGAYVTNFVISNNEKNNVIISSKNMSCVLSDVSTDAYKKKLKKKFGSNGERIYNIAQSSSKKIIKAEVGGMKMSSPMMSCVDCHKNDGSGGEVVLMGKKFKVPSIRYQKLHKELNDEQIKKVITQGIEPGGDKIKYPMPKWTMNNKDYSDLIIFLKSL